MKHYDVCTFMKYETTALWLSTLGKQGDADVDRLRVAYQTMREHVKGLLDEVRKDFPNLTVHNIEHADDLWKIASGKIAIKTLPERNMTQKRGDRR